jgi:MFS family permease
LLRLSAFVFILMFAIGMASPVVPLYASSLDASWTEIGLMGTSWGTTLMFLALLTGRLSDRFGRKPLLIASGMLSAFAALIYLVSWTVGQVILVRVVEGAAWALFWPVVEAFATEVVELKQAGYAMGIVTTSYGVAFASGSLTGGSIVGMLGYVQMFASYLGISLASVLVAVLILQETRPAGASSTSKMKQADRNPRGWISRTILPAYFLGSMYTFGLGMMLSLFSVFAKGLGVSVFWIGALFGVFWAGRIDASFTCGRISDKYGRKSIAVIAMVSLGLGFVLLSASTGIEPLLGSVAILGFSIGAAFPVSVALISDNVQQSVRGYAMGLFETSCAAGFMAASTIGGFLADFLSPRAPYLFATITSLSSAAVLALTLPGTKSVRSAEPQASERRMT